MPGRLNDILLAAVSPPGLSASSPAIAPEFLLLGILFLLVALAGLYCLIRLLGAQNRQLQALETLAAERRAADQNFAELSRSHFNTEQNHREAVSVDEKQLQQARSLLADAVVTLQRLKHE